MQRPYMQNSQNNNTQAGRHGSQSHSRPPPTSERETRQPLLQTGPREVIDLTGDDEDETEPGSSNVAAPQFSMPPKSTPVVFSTVPAQVSPSLPVRRQEQHGVYGKGVWRTPLVSPQPRLQEASSFPAFTSTAKLPHAHPSGTDPTPLLSLSKTRSTGRSDREARPASSSRVPSAASSNATLMSAPQLPSPMQATTKRKSCLTCVELGTACDGGRPCSACVEPDLVCEYSDEDPQHHSSSLSLPPGDTLNGKSIGISNPPSPHQPNKRLSWLTSGPAWFSASSDITKPSLHTKDVRLETSHEDSSGSDGDETTSRGLKYPPQSYTAALDLLKMYEVQMQGHREYLLQALLLQSVVDSKQRDGPKLNTSRPSPFTKLIVQREATSGRPRAQTGRGLQLQVKSHRGAGSKKFLPISVPTQKLPSDPNVLLLPKYKSIGRLGASFLARNVHTLKHWPYFVDDEYLDPEEKDEKHLELEQRYKTNDSDLLKQKKCQELVRLWQPWVEDFMRDLQVSHAALFSHMSQNEQPSCATCEKPMERFDPEVLAEVQKSLVSLGEGGMSELTRAKWCCDALLEKANISMWHITIGDPEIERILRKSKRSEVGRNRPSKMCSICFLHNCGTHGSYVDLNEEGVQENVLINDPESKSNIKVMVNAPRAVNRSKHRCGFYCVPGALQTSLSLGALWGRREDGRVLGKKHPSHETSASPFSDDTTCGPRCFWMVENRLVQDSHLSVNLSALKAPLAFSETQTSLFHTLFSVFAKHQRSPCMIARVMKVTCMDVFLHVLYDTYHLNTHPTGSVIEEDVSEHGRKVSKAAGGYDTSASRTLDLRPPFVFCSHKGPCLEQNGCSCATAQVHCEWFCGCDGSCKRRFNGCKCKGRPCFNDDRCECWAANRECDPWLCGHCGVLEVLDPNNKYRDDIRQGRCQNNRIQLDLPARTIKAPSEVQGWGLYAGQDLEENTFIGEYKGEIVSEKEGDRRGVVYHNIGQEYLFVMNEEQQIDGSNFGNKTRFMNNSQLDKNINVLAKTLFTNGVQRVMFHTKRPVKAGEELLYNYNYPDHVVKNFWERGERSQDKVGVVAPPPQPPRVNGRFVKSVVSKQDGEESSARKQDQAASLGRFKRKRPGETGTPGFHDTLTQGEPSRVGESQGVDESDYEEEATSDVSEHSDGLEQTDSESESENSDKPLAWQAKRKRRLFPGDRRQGGNAQRRAWETRKRHR